MENILFRYLYHDSTFPPESVSENDIPYFIFYNDNWNDYGHRTLFNIQLHYKGEKYPLSGIKILFEGDIAVYKSYREDYHCANSSLKFREFFSFVVAGGDPYQYSEKFISVFTDIDFFVDLTTILERHLCKQDVKQIVRSVFTTFHEAGYIEAERPEYNVSSIIASRTFEDSLLRSSSSVKAYKEAYLRFYKDDTQFDYSFELVGRTPFSNYSINIDFSHNHDELSLPSNINVIVGSNGVGKTKAIESFLTNFKPPFIHAAQNQLPAFRNIVCFSYSPFESFESSSLTSTTEQSLAYFGIKEPDGTINVGLPEKDSANSLLRALRSDFEKRNVTEDNFKRFDFIQNILAKEAGIDFDDVFFQVNSTDGVDSIFLATVEGRSYVAASGLMLSGLFNLVLPDASAILIKDQAKVFLSSGQKMFFYITCCLVGNIGSETLLIMDEPECYLHPTLEVMLVALLKKFLIEFNSYALIATHSMVIAREIPSKCVHILRKHNNEVKVTKPQFETFGARLEKICSHVFDDYDKVAPYQEWATNELSDKSVEELSEEFRNALSPELLAYLNWGK